MSKRLKAVNAENKKMSIEAFCPAEIFFQIVGLSPNAIKKQNTKVTPNEQVLPMVGQLKNLRLATEVHYLVKD